MENELIVRRNVKPLTAVEVKAQVKVIQEILEHVMIKDVHYGTIPGTPKPTLYKPGSEKILSTFHIGVDPREELVDLSSEDEVRYRVYVKGFSQMTGELLGVGVGECSSNEEKYRWRKPVCNEEFEETLADRKRIVWKHGQEKAYQQKQIRTNSIDIANTILKMAKKRSQIDMTLTVTAASDVFDQDLEDLPEGMEVGQNGKPPIKEPQKKKTEQPQPDNAPPIVITTIKKVTMTSGKKKDGSPWTLYAIHAEDGERYSTFDKSMAEIAKAFGEKKTRCTITFEATDKGKNLTEIKEYTDEEREPGSEG